MKESIVLVPFSFQWRRVVDEGEGGVTLLLRRRLGLPWLLDTLLVPQPCEGVRLELLLHLQ